jgi:CheY-like chemotaxis protein
LNPACRIDGPPRSEARTTILVVEDEALVRLMVADELRASGFTVVEAVNADEALQVLGSVDVDLVFTDIRMQGEFDGIELAVIVQGRYPAVKIVLTSAHLGRDSVPAKVDGFLDKPYAIADLVNLIKRLLS